MSCFVSFQSQFSKGKLCCERCEGRVGAFDFLSVIRCVCGKHNIPPIRVAKNRVDLCRPPQVPQGSDAAVQSNSHGGSVTPTDNQQQKEVHGSPSNATGANREMDAILQSGLSSNAVTSEGSRSRRGAGSVARSHIHRKVRNNRREDDDSGITGDTDSDSGIQSRPASDSESEGGQQVQGKVDNNDRSRSRKSGAGNRFQELQESGESPENVSALNDHTFVKLFYNILLFIRY